MKNASVWACGLALVWAISGCSRGTPPEADVSVTVAEGGPTKSALKEVDLSGANDAVDLAELLKLSREDLAARCIETEKQIQLQEQFRQEGKLKFGLLPEVRLPLTVPVFRHAAFSKTRGLSLPPYLKDDARDSAVAYHLARFGDLDAGIQLLEADDDETAKLLRDSALQKNYPVEWTRLVGLLQQNALITLASDLKEGANQLIAIHRQLRAVLDEKAQVSPLGAALMSRGLATLKQAAVAWQASGRKDLSDQINDFLASASPPPAWTLALPTHADALAKPFGQKAGSRALIAKSNERAMDLLGLHLPHEIVDTCVAFFDGDKKVSEILVTFRPTLFDYQQPEQLAQALEERLAGRKDDISVDTPRRLWDLPQGKLEIILTPRHATLGGLLRLQLGGTAKPAELGRDFGLVSLDRTFEQNRRLAAWPKRGASISLGEKFAAELNNPLPTRVISQAVMDREPKHDLVSRVALEFAEDHKETMPALGQIAQPLLIAAGRPQFVFGEGNARGQIDLVWSDAKTRYRLRFPHGKDRPVTLEVADASGADFVARQDAAQAKDIQDRKARIDAGKPLAVIPRQLDKFALGMSKADAIKGLPDSPQLIRRDIPGGFMAAYLGTPPSGDAVAREWFARFADDRLVEMRIRFVDVPANKPGTFLKKMDGIKAKLGPSESSVGTGVKWDDLPARGTGQAHSWQDDLTSLTCRQESFGLEVIVRDCPPDQPQGGSLPDLEYLSKGTAQCLIGLSKDELVKLGARPNESAFLLPPNSKDSYDAILAWVDNGKVVRVVARHKAATPMKTESQASKVLLEQWARDSRTLGWPLRQDMSGSNLQSLASRDDRIRYRMFWQDEGGQISVFSEWRDVK